jgi:hypothetical protein
VADPDLLTLARTLLEAAARGGASPELLREAKSVLFALITDSVSLARLEAAQDARQQQSEVERLHGTGLTIAAACARAGVSARTFYRRRRACQRSGTSEPGATVSLALKNWR